MSTSKKVYARFEKAWAQGPSPAEYAEFVAAAAPWTVLKADPSAAEKAALARWRPIVRAADDPPTATRAAERARGGGFGKQYKRAARSGQSELRATLLDATADGRPRTLNRIAREAFDLEADRLPDSVFEALRSLVADRRLAFWSPGAAVVLFWNDQAWRDAHPERPRAPAGAPPSVPLEAVVWRADGERHTAKVELPLFGPGELIVEPGAHGHRARFQRGDGYDLEVARSHGDRSLELPAAKSAAEAWLLSVHEAAEKAKDAEKWHSAGKIRTPTKRRNAMHRRYVPLDRDTALILEVIPQRVPRTGVREIRAVFVPLPELDAWQAPRPGKEEVQVELLKPNFKGSASEAKKAADAWARRQLAELAADVAERAEALA